MKNIKSILGIIMVVAVVVALAGCTSSPETKKSYNGSSFSIDYPTSWSLSYDNGDKVGFKTPNGEVKLFLYDNVKYPASYEGWVDEKIGNVSYKKQPATLNDGLISYAVIKEGKDFILVGVPQDEAGHKMILESVKF